jgi:hypothetical protein
VPLCFLVLVQDGASSDEESRRRDRKRRKMKEKEKKGHHRRHKSEKEKSSKDDRKKSRDEKKRKRRKRHAESDSGSDSEDAEDRKKRRLLKEAKRLLRKHKSEGDNGALVPATSGLKVDKISEEDYFEKSNELAMWLKEAKGVFFSSLSSEETHKEFAKFVEVWNAGQLTPKYYQGIKSAPRTAHKWGIKLNHDEALALGMCLNYYHVPYLWPCKSVWLNSRHVYSLSDKLRLSFSAF